MRILVTGEKEVREANRKVYNRKSVELYEANPSIFEVHRQSKIRQIIAELAHKNRGTKFLDIGCGTGQILRLARNYFDLVVGIDIAKELLKKTIQIYPGLNLVAAEAKHPPFVPASFDVVALYGTLHHFYDPGPILKIIYHLLKPNGYLYTDHDPNYFFNRFYHLYYRFRWWDRPGFGSIEEEIAEFHHTQTLGLNPELIQKQLHKIGFSAIRIFYRHTTNPTLGPVARWLLRGLKIISVVFPFKSLYSHFYIIARK